MRSILPLSLFCSFSLLGTVAILLTPRGCLPESLIVLGFCFFLCGVEKVVLTPLHRQKAYIAGSRPWYPMPARPLCSPPCSDPQWALLLAAKDMALVAKELPSPEAGQGKVSSEPGNGIRPVLNAQCAKVRKTAL